MTWTRLSDDFTDDPELLTLPRAVRYVHVEALVWSNRHSTDGRIPAHALTRITDEPAPDQAAARLVAAGKWKPTETGWEIIGFLDDQLSADEVNRRKELTRERQRRNRQHKAGDHTECDPKHCRAKAGVVTRHVTRDKTRESRHPDPTRPDPKGLGSGKPAKPCAHSQRTAGGDCVACGADAEEIAS